MSARTLGVPVHEVMRAAREASGMTQRAVARRLYIGQSTVNNWEAGRRVPNVDMLDAYLRLVGGSITLGTVKR